MNPWQELRQRGRNGHRDPVQLADGEVERLRLRPRPEPEREAPPLRLRLRRFLRPLPLAGAALVLVALVGYLSVYNASTKRTPVLVVARDLPAGSVVRASDLRIAELAGDRRTMGALVPEGELGQVVGRTLATGIASGTPLSRAALGRRASRAAAFTLVVPVLHALGGELRAGDRVTVLATFAGAAGGARARALARALEVLSVGAAPDGLSSATATVPVTVALPDPSLAAQLALANSEGKIDLLREGAGSTTAPIPPAAEATR